MMEPAGAVETTGCVVAVEAAGSLNGIRLCSIFRELLIRRKLRCVAQ